MAVQDVSITLNKYEWEHIMKLIQKELQNGCVILMIRYNLQIYDKIDKCLEKALEENSVN